MESGLDSLVTTLETDCGLTSDNVPVLYHGRVFRAEQPGETGGKSRRKLGTDIPARIRDVSFASIQDLMRIPDSSNLSAGTGLFGDVGLGAPFFSAARFFVKSSELRKVLRIVTRMSLNGLRLSLTLAGNFEPRRRGAPGR